MHVLCEDLRRCVGYPVGDEERLVFREGSFVEDQKKFATVGTKALDRVRISSGKEPEVAFADVTDEDGAVGVEDGDAGIAIEHEGPLVGGVPVKFAVAA